MLQATVVLQQPGFCHRCQQLASFVTSLCGGFDPALLLLSAGNLVLRRSWNPFHASADKKRALTSSTSRKTDVAYIRRDYRDQRGSGLAIATAMYVLENALSLCLGPCRVLPELPAVFWAALIGTLAAWCLCRRHSTAFTYCHACAIRLPAC